MNNAIEETLKKVTENKLTTSEALHLIEKLYQEGSIKNRKKEFESLSQNKFTRSFIYDEPYLRDHTVFGEQVLLGVTHCSLAIEAARSIYPKKTFIHIHKLIFIEPVILYPDEKVDIAVNIEKKDQRILFRNIYKKSSQQEYKETASGEYIFGSLPQAFSIDVSRFRKQSEKSLSGEDIYQKEISTPIIHGPSLRTIQNILICGHEVLGELSLTKEIIENSDHYSFHPALLDGAILGSASALDIKDPTVPLSIKDVYIYGELPEKCLCYSKIVKSNSEVIVVDIQMFNEEGQVFLSLNGFTCKRIRAQESFGKLHPNVQSKSHASTKSVYQVRSTGRTNNLEGTIEQYIINKITPHLGNAKGQVNTSKNFLDLGIDSNQLIAIAQEIEKEVGIELYPTLFFEYPNIKENSVYFAKEFKEQFSRFLKFEEEKPDSVKTIQQEQSNEQKNVITDVLKKDDTPIPKFIIEDESPLIISQKIDTDDIAVIGMAGIFADSPNLNLFWQNLRDKKDLIKEIPLNHFDYRPWFDPDPQAPDKMYCKWGSFIEDIDKFDAGFFHISPREAEVMDPQLRLLLQVLYNTSEDAGYAARIRGSKTGVYVGVCFHDYCQEMDRQGKPIFAHDVTGNASTMLANRPSFYFDLKGPSLSIDTACSSSLVALHIACNALQKKECDMAFVAGVNALLGSVHYRYFCSIGALSPTGRCHTFDKGADGYVPGEAIATVLLKPLKKALQDRDQIHAIIKGAAINHGGYTPSVTAPSTKLEAEVILDAWKDAGIDPETIGYIESHGTGTKLGDPVEINALKNAFKKHTNKERFCAVGSVKAHIGHTEGAAGIAGIIKVILSIKNSEIPAMPKFKELNPYIQLDNTPLYINTEVEKWHRINGAPRRAGVSSFGFGGAYAHVVVEEYEQPITQSIQQTDEVHKSQIIVLSAQSEERLKAYAIEMAAFLEKKQEEGSEISIGDIAYTLQIGREEMVDRLAVIASDIGELTNKLKEYCQGKTVTENLYRGNVKARKAKTEKLIEGKAGEEFLRIIINEREFTKIAQLWVFGLEIDWNLLYPDHRPNLISLPTYPFAKERYWFQESDENIKITQNGYGPIVKIHPLIDQNTSTLREERFSTQLNGNEFYLKDHIVNGQKVLPGVTYIEMACAAGEIAGEKKVKRLKNIVWTRPIGLANELMDVSISLYPKQDGVEYEVSTNGGNHQRVVHSQGKVVYEPKSDSTTETEKIDIETIKKRCSDLKYSEECYRLFQERGLKYGPSFQPIQKLWSNGIEAISLLRLPSQSRDGFNDFILHPTLMDGALQTTIGLTINTQMDSGGLYLPFALGEVELLKPLSETCYAYVTSKDGKTSPVKIFDIQLMDETGQVLVRMKDFSARAFQQHPMVKDLPIKSGILDMMYYRRVWEKSALAFERRSKALSGPILIFDDNENVYQALNERLEDKAEGKRLIWIKPGKDFKDMGNFRYEMNPSKKGHYVQLLEALKVQHMMPNIIIHLWSKDDFSISKEAIHSQLDRCAYSLFYLNQVIMEQKPKDRIQTLYVYASSTDKLQPLYAAVSGFAKTIHQENPKLCFKIIELQNSSGEPLELNLSKQIDILLKEVQADSDDVIEIRFTGEQRWVKRFLEFDPEEEAAQKKTDEKAVPLRDRGVYIITGGIGGLGLIFANYLAKEVKARLVLSDLSELNDEKKTKIKELESLGSEVAYIRADVSKHKDVMDLILEAKSRFGEINGILHCAGVIRDAFLMKKTKDEMDIVLAPKVFGTVYLDEATKNENLDFFVLFSSIAGALGNAGQCDYAYGNSFMDHFALMRDGLQQKGKRIGKTLSINWPLWKEGGMKLDDQTKTWMKEKIGIVPLHTENGIKAFKDGLRLTSAGLMVVEGEREKFNILISKNSSKDAMKNNQAPKENKIELTHGEDPQFQEKTESFLKEILSKETKLPVSRIKSQDSLEKYGIDSVMIVNLSRVLESFFGELSKTLFFENQTIRELAKYFIENYREKLIKYLDLSQNVQPMKIELQGVEPKELEDLHRPRFWDAHGLVSEELSNKDINKQEEDIAIIGVSGRYPMARNLEAFWENLKAGKDCITEIPKERWDFRTFDDSDKNKDGKTYCKWGGFIDHVDKFDPLFFNISPREAELLDPQERLFLEATWHTLEDAGYSKSSLENSKVGVFVGVMWGLYQLFGVNGSLNRDLIAPSSSYASIANRVSYYFNFHGPSIALDTMCSSSLTTIHLACESIRRGESELAIAGGVNVSVHPHKYIQLGQLNFTSSDGRCRSFGEGGDGYVPGEGVGAVLLKPLSKAISDGDHIYAVIKGSSLNHGGKTNGYTVPNPNAQASLISEALKRTKIDPRTISYLEAHGTGTSLGDPIEMTGLMKAFREHTQDKQYCSIGSVKSNIGHLESAAGIASITKVLLQMKHKQLVPSIHSEKLNPHIHFESSPFYVQRKLEEWKQPVIKLNRTEKRYPRRAGISSFGAGGANAHIILEEYERPSSETAPIEQGPQIIVLSAKDEERLGVYVRRILDYLEKESSSIPLDQPEEDTDLIEKRQNELLQYTSEILQVSDQEIGLDNDIEEYGFDHISKTELVEKINQKYNLQITSSIFSEHPTLASLSKYVHKMSKTDIREPKNSVDLSLGDIAYTLQVGREAMDERLAVVVSNMKELIDKFKKFSNGNADIENLYRWNVKTDKANIKDFIEGEDRDYLIRSMVKNKKYTKLAQLWVGGVEIDWALLYPTSSQKKIPLPTYPFSLNRYWIGKTIDQSYPDAELKEISGEKTSEVRSDDDHKDEHKIMNEIKSIIANILKLDSGELKENITIDEFGVDSILLMEIFNKITNQYHLNIKISDIQNLSTIKQLGKYVYETLNNGKGVISSNKSNADESNAVQNRSVPTKTDNDRRINKLESQYHSKYIDHYKYAFSSCEGYENFFVQTSQQMNIEVITCGEGEPIIFLPPILSLATAWMYQILEFSKEFKTIVFHYPGFGRSEYNSQYSNLNDIADSILEFIDILNIQNSYHLVGWSMGGLISEIISLREKQRIKTLTLVNTTSKLEEKDTIDNCNRIVQFLKKDFESHVPVSMKSKREGMMDFIKALYSNELALHYLEQVLQFDFRDQISMIKLPTLIITGGKDELTPARYSEYLHHEIKNSDYHILKKGGHYIPLQNHNFFNRKLRSFLNMIG